MKNSNPRQHYSRINKWISTNIDEFNVFIALLVLQGIIRKPELQMYFSTDELLATPIFNKIMAVTGYAFTLYLFFSFTFLYLDADIIPFFDVISFDHHIIIISSLYSFFFYFFPGCA